MTTENTQAAAPTTVTGEGTPTIIPAGAAAGAPTEGAAPPAPEVATPIITEGVDNGKGVVTYSPTGNSSLDMALAYIGKQGFAPDHPAMVAAIDGNFDLLAAELSTKNPPGYEAHILLARNAFTTIRAETLAKQKADTEAVHKVAGGEANWKSASEWAAANADDSEKAELKAMLGKGGASAKMAASFIVNAYNKTLGSQETAGAGPAVTAVKGTSTTTGTLSSREYGTEVAKARASYRGRDSFESSTVYANLQARRRAHRD